MAKTGAKMGRPARKPADLELVKRMGQKLKWVRDAMGLTQEEIAAAVGVHQTAWSLYERGKRWPDQFEAERLVAKLKISRDYLTKDTLAGVEADLATRLAASHPELVPPIRKEPRTDKRRA